MYQRGSFTIKANMLVLSPQFTMLTRLVLVVVLFIDIKRKPSTYCLVFNFVCNFLFFYFFYLKLRITAVNKRCKDKKRCRCFHQNSNHSMEIYTDDLCLVVTVNLFSCDIEYSVVLLVCSFMRKTCFFCIVFLSKICSK